MVGYCLEAAAVRSRYSALTLTYYLRGPLGNLWITSQVLEPARNRILLPVANPQTAEGWRDWLPCWRGMDGTSVSVLSVVAIQQTAAQGTQQFSAFCHRQRRC